MEMRSFSVEARSSVAHDANFLPLSDTLACFDVSFRQMRVKAEQRAAIPVVFYNDILTVVASTCLVIDVGDYTAIDSLDGIKRAVILVPFERANINTLVKTCAD